MKNATISDATLNHREVEVALKKINRRIQELENFDISTVSEFADPKIIAFELSLKTTISNIFGTFTDQYRMYSDVWILNPSAHGTHDNPSSDEIRRRLKKNIEKSLLMLKIIQQDFRERLEDSSESPSKNTIKAYELLDIHKEIRSQVSGLYTDGHYSEAIEKSIKVLNNLVRLRSGEDLDGVSLMEKVFSPKKPILKFNSMQDESDKNEQLGLMKLFSGAVTGFRNPRAHKIIKDDPERSLEIIAFISLLAKLADSAEM